MELACGRFAVLFSNYNDARVAVASLPPSTCRLPSSLHSAVVGWRKSWIFDCRQPRAPYGVSALTDCRSLVLCSRESLILALFGPELSSIVAHSGLKISYHRSSCRERNLATMELTISSIISFQVRTADKRRRTGSTRKISRHCSPLLCSLRVTPRPRL